MKIITQLALLILLHFSLFLLPSSAAQYSKLQIITTAKELQRWDGLKAWIQQSGYYDEWLVCQYLSDDHPAVPALTNALVSSGVLTAQELGTILTKSKDTSIPDAVLIGRYARDVKSENGRVAWHGKRVSWKEDVNSLTITEVYEDGTQFVTPFEKRRPKSLEARLALQAKKDKAAEEERLAQLPPGLQAVERQRQENASKTNEVNVTITPQAN